MNLPDDFLSEMLSGHPSQPDNHNPQVPVRNLETTKTQLLGTCYRTISATVDGSGR